MPYQQLDIPRLRTSPYPEADFVKKASGVDFDTPTLVITTEGNRKILKNSGVAELIRVENALERGGDFGGMYVPVYNLVLLQPGLKPRYNLKARLHEAAHSLRASILDYNNIYPPSESPDLRARGEDVTEELLVKKIYDEGLASYWEQRTLTREVEGLSGAYARKAEQEAILRGFDRVDLTKLETVAIEPVMYPLGHALIDRLMDNLEPLFGKHRTISLLAKSEPKSIDEIRGMGTRKKFPTYLNLGVRDTLNLRGYLLFRKLFSAD